VRCARRLYRLSPPTASGPRGCNASGR